MKSEKVQQHLLETLEHEKRDVLVYETALRCAMNADLTEEWQEYLHQTRKHIEILQGVCKELNIDTDSEIPSLKVVRHLGDSLVKAMEIVLQNGDHAAAEIVAAECVVHAETKGHSNWQSIGQIAKKSKGNERRVLKDAYEKVEKEDEHLYRTKGWAEELHIQTLSWITCSIHERMHHLRRSLRQVHLSQLFQIADQKRHPFLHLLRRMY